MTDAGKQSEKAYISVPASLSLSQSFCLEQDIVKRSLTEDILKTIQKILAIVGDWSLPEIIFLRAIPPEYDG